VDPRAAGSVVERPAAVVVSAGRRSRPRAYLLLSRLSNLPTVWTNVLAATALAGGDPFALRTALVVAAMTLFYVGGMYLNDAFDRAIDARERPGRPIPAGEISAAAVFALGFGMVALAIVMTAFCGPAAAVCALALGAAIIAYDVFHKGNPTSPLMMSLCRMLVYLGAAAAATGSVALQVWIAGAAIAAHVAGLTYAAKQEGFNRIHRLWPLAILAIPVALGLAAVWEDWPTTIFLVTLAAVDWFAVDKLRRRAAPDAVPSAVSSLIAAISLVDAVLVAPVSLSVAALCASGYFAARLAQRVVPGT
jgi:hypothetical protein